MRIKLKHFGLGTIDLPEYMELPEGTNIEEFVYLIQKNVEIPSEYLSTSTFLVNNSKADKNTVLNDGDEVLILRPLGGG